eukprot:TRINITY_DN111989_c0_g1_i1.p2 TRINITY_DN111989_c0_g1~~TRINITY_DN111989_c0_g1_i1.p2  ORF type:complete len:112 (+),score=5.56 TRINITY_DN111989_c0_g1_i1:37-336(+)
MANAQANDGHRRGWQKGLIPHKNIIDGSYTPKVKIQRLPHVKERPGRTMQLSCRTCKALIVSHWWFEQPEKKPVSLIPHNGHKVRVRCVDIMNLCCRCR